MIQQQEGTVQFDPMRVGMVPLVTRSADISASFPEAPLSRARKTLAQLLTRRADASIRFSDLADLLKSLGFQRRTRGSHVIFSHPQVRELINLQSMAGTAKAYQVRQVRRTLLAYGMTRLERGSDGE